MRGDRCGSGIDGQRRTPEHGPYYYVITQTVYDRDKYKHTYSIIKTNYKSRSKLLNVSGDSQS